MVTEIRVIECVHIRSEGNGLEIASFKLRAGVFGALTLVTLEVPAGTYQVGDVLPMTLGKIEAGHGEAAGHGQ